MSILVTGGAGYIGSHVVRLLVQRGDDVVAVDDLSSGSANKIGEIPLIELDLSSDSASKVLQGAFETYAVDAVMHFAAHKQVSVSMARPTFYMRQNVGGMTNLLDAMEARGVHRLVYSSSAAVYGMPNVATVSEEQRCVPINTYGDTKLIGEWMCQRSADAWGLGASSLRYFNVAGAGWADLGDSGLLNLIPIVFDSLLRGERPRVFGDRYPTADGTCVRDYVHVLDLAEAHLAALDTINGARHELFNIGTGIGASVLEVIGEIQRTTGLDTQPEIVGPREGDPARLVANVDRAMEVLGWRSSRTLPEIIETAWDAYQRS